MGTDTDWMDHHVLSWGQTQIRWTILSSHGDRYRYPLPNTLLKPTLLASANHKSILSTHGFEDYILVYVCNLRHPVSRNQFMIVSMLRTSLKWKIITQRYHGNCPHGIAQREDPLFRKITP